MALTVSQAQPGTLAGVGTAIPGGFNGVQPLSGAGQLGGQAANPQNANNGVNYSGQVNGTNTAATLGFDTSGGSGGTGGSSAQTAADAAAAAAEAARIAKVTQYRGNITNLAKSIMDVYDSLYGAANTAFGDQAGKVNQKYDTQTQGLTDQFNQDFPTIGNSFASRGAYDSGYRQVAEDNATKSFNNQLDLQGQGRQGELAAIGMKLAGTKGNIDAERGDIGYKLAQIQQTEDPNELLQMQNQIQTQLQAAHADQSQLGTQGGYAAQAEAVAPSGDQTAALRSQLSSIVQGQAAPVLKNSVGQKLIAASGLADKDKQALAQELAAQIADQQKLQQPQG